MAALAGVRILTMALNVPGPVAVARLVAEGATALKIEPPAGDPLATYCPAWYRALHERVAVEAVDLKTPGGRARFHAHLADADVLLTSQRPAALERLGLGVDALARRFPALRRVDIVGDTTRPNEPGHDLTYQFEAGLVDASLPPTLLADLAGAERTATAILLTWVGGPGSSRTVGLREAADAFAEPRRHGLTAAGALLGGTLPAYGVYHARDGVVAIAALEPHFRSRLYDVLRLPLDSPLDAAVRGRSCAEWAALAAAHDLPVAVRQQAPPRPDTEPASAP